jgi:hypothetical protein
LYTLAGTSTTLVRLPPGALTMLIAPSMVASAAGVAAGEGEVDVDEVGVGDADGGRRGLDVLPVGADRDGAGLDVEQHIVAGGVGDGVGRRGVGALGDDQGAGGVGADAAGDRDALRGVAERDEGDAGGGVVDHLIGVRRHRLVPVVGARGLDAVGVRLGVAEVDREGGAQAGRERLVVAGADGEGPPQRLGEAAVGLAAHADRQVVGAAAVADGDVGDGLADLVEGRDQGAVDADAGEGVADAAAQAQGGAADEVVAVDDRLAGEAGRAHGLRVLVVLGVVGLGGGDHVGITRGAGREGRLLGQRLGLGLLAAGGEQQGRGRRQSTQI